MHFGLCENGEKKAVVKKPIINCGQYKTRTADYLLRTGYKIRTTDYFSKNGANWF